jgi:hypothetical protein
MIMKIEDSLFCGALPNDPPNFIKISPRAHAYELITPEAYPDSF